MKLYSDYTINKVRNIDLLSYLQENEPDNLVKEGRYSYCTKEHDSLKISNGLWYWFSKGFGGKNALDYLMKVKDYSFIDAVKKLLEKSYEVQIDETKNSFVPSKFILPEANDNNEKVIKYLRGRGIDLDIINECISKNLLYEDKNHNAVFVGYDKENIPRYAFIRGTGYTRFLKEAYGSHKAFSFKLDAYNNENNSMHLFESAIDLLSYASINKNKFYKENLLSLAGVYQPQKNIEDSKLPLALNYYLLSHKNIRKVYLHFDNDEVGRGATEVISYLLKKLHYEVVDEPAKSGKDFNDYLCNLVEEKNKKKHERER